MRHIFNGRIVEVEIGPDGTIDSETLRKAAGIPSERPLIAQLADGRNIQVNPGDRVKVKPGQTFIDAPVHDRGYLESDTPAHPFIAIVPASEGNGTKG